MLLTSDYITPAELTGYVRAALADAPANAFALAQWLPNRSVADLTYRFVRGGGGLVEAATYRAWDAETPIGSRPGAVRVTGELPPVSRKVRLGEYDALRLRGATDAVTTEVLADAVRMARAVSARLELARGQALVTGKVTIAENGLAAEADYGRTGGHTVAAATSWATTASATVLADLLSWRDTYVATTGVEPGAVVTSRKVLGYMLRNAEMRALVATTAGSPAVASQSSLEAVLAAHGLPPVTVYDARVSVAGTPTRVIAEDKLLLLPAPVDPYDAEGTDLGATVWGITAESLEPGYGIEPGAEPGIVAGAYHDQEPVAVWTKAAGIGLPVLANPDLSFCADVVP